MRIPHIHSFLFSVWPTCFARRKKTWFWLKWPFFNHNRSRILGLNYMTFFLMRDTKWIFQNSCFIHKFLKFESNYYFYSYVTKIRCDAPSKTSELRQWSIDFDEWGFIWLRINFLFNFLQLVRLPVKSALLLCEISLIKRNISKTLP